MNDPEIYAELRSLGIRLQLNDVRQIIQLLKDGSSVYRIRESGVAAKDSIRKIRNLYQQGKLQFLYDTSAEEEIVKIAISEASVSGNGQHTANHEGAGSLERISGRILADLPSINWNVQVLKSLGLSTDDSLELMLDRDDLEHRRSTWKLSDLSRYLELYLTVDYYYQSKDLENKPPFNFAKLAAKAKADGIINSNRALQEIADNIIRYEVWSGGPYREAFGHAQVVTSRSAKNFREHYGQIIDSYINGGIGELTQPLLPPSISE